MSTTLMGAILPEVVSYCSSVFSVDGSRKTEKLSDYVRRVRKEKGFSTTDVENQSGRRISDAYVTRIENGQIRNVSPEKLSALAKGLEVSEDELFAVARGKAIGEPETPVEFGVLFYGWAEASEEDRAATLDAIQMIAESFQRRRRRKPKKPPNTPPGKGKK